MVPPTGDDGIPAPIDRPILEFHQTRIQATGQVSHAAITDTRGHLELQVVFASSYYPASVDDATLTVHWYTNDDFTIHYQEVHSEHTWKCRWDQHPNPHNTRDHFHPPPTAPTPGDDDSWPTDHRDVLQLILDEVEDRIAALWDE
ncbi:hypothetical protein [Haloarcula nitratireducens]|uniref:Uncharacterized protein n=1 Tax=Haloarcula nitratireducens TaxID=2487749 RepID=A0AAW4PFF6_9EURY|nr:hypothetical protein [Halomicroarcula nitratireducens]MBX0296564.1 hypothetical protein [Halomicroarcula nitratireducens]